jgi:hypothetical protein
MEPNPTENIMTRLWAALALAVLLTAGAATLGQDPGKKEGELLPPPRLVMPPGDNLIPFAYVPPHVPRWGTRDVWQFYGVDGSGRFRPRVIHSPYGAYYATNGADYPWTTTRPMLFMPYAVD